MKSIKFYTDWEDLRLHKEEFDILLPVNVQAANVDPKIVEEMLLWN